MFPARYFARRYFPGRYFPPVVVVLPHPVELAPVPVGLTAVAALSSVNLSWEPVTPVYFVTAYRLYRWTGSAYTPLTTVGGGVTTTNSGFLAAVPQTFVVTSVDSVLGESAYSLPATATPIEPFKVRGAS